MANLTYCHCGSLGDMIYSLPIVKHYGNGDYYVKLHSVEYIAIKYGYQPQHVNNFHRGKLTEDDFKLIAPLLEAQSYVNNVIATADSEMKVTHDLDKFRGVLFRTFLGNYLEAYFKTFNVLYTQQDIITPWLQATPKKVAPLVIARTFRMRNPASTDTWKNFTSLPTFTNDAIFIGLPEEHADFEQVFNVAVPHYKCKDFLDMAEVIAGCDHFISNSTFAYSLAQGLGKSTSLEHRPDVPLDKDEAYFPRADCFYF